MATHSLTRARLVKAAKARPRRAAREEKMRNRPAGSKVNAGTAKRRDMRGRSAER